MTFKTLVATGTFAALFGTSALAADQAVLDQIVQDLAAQGYQHIEIVNAPNRVRVEAYGPNGSIEQTYDGQGTVLTEAPGSGTGSGTGTGTGMGSGTGTGSGTGMGSGSSTSSDDDPNDDQSDDQSDDSVDENDHDSSPDHTQTRTQTRENDDDDHHQAGTRTQTRSQNHDGGGHRGGDDD